MAPDFSESHQWMLDHHLDEREKGDLGFFRFFGELKMIFRMLGILFYFGSIDFFFESPSEDGNEFSEF